MVVVTKFDSCGYCCYNFETKDEAVSFLKMRISKDINFRFNEEYYSYGDRYIMEETEKPQESDPFCGINLEEYYEDMI